MGILVPSWSPTIQLGNQYTIDWSHPITNQLNFVQVTNNLLPTHTYSKFATGTLGNVNCKPALGNAGVGLCGGVGLSDKIYWTGSGPSLGTKGTVVCYTTIGVQGFNRFLFRLDDGTQANSLFIFTPSTVNFYYGWWLNSGTQSYKTSAFTIAAGSTLTVAMTWDTAAPFETIWVNGLSSSNTDAFSTTDTSNFSLTIGNATTQNISWLDVSYARIYWIAFWDRVLNNNELIYLNANPMCFLVPAEYEMPILNYGQFWQLYFSKNSGAYSPVTTTSVGVKSADASSDADETKILVPRL